MTSPRTPSLRPSQRRRLAAAGAAMILLAGMACGSSSSPAKTARPSTTARIRIASPDQNAVTGPDVHIVVELLGGRLVPIDSTKLVANGGHIHLSVDGQVRSMTAGLEQDVTGLAPGNHTITAEFVAADHLPFDPRKAAAVVIEVRQQ